MNSPAFDRIMDELAVHPKERLGFKNSDFDSLHGSERQIIFDRILQEAEEGWGYAEQLEWMLGAIYTSFLEQRLAVLSKGSHGLVSPYLLFLKSKRREYLLRMMQEILVAENGWEQREAAVGGYLRELIGDEPVFWDFCRHIILNVADTSMKEDAMLWLAYQKGYPLQGLVLPDSLAACVHALDVSKGTDPVAKGVLDQLHADTGHFSVPTGF